MSNVFIRYYRFLLHCILCFFILYRLITGDVAMPKNHTKSPRVRTWVLYKHSQAFVTRTWKKSTWWTLPQMFLLVLPRSRKAISVSHGSCAILLFL
uniref:Uncharacterized protein n=1 Tax=Arundo donax TaxID=35708 RepID=A0A0A9CR06_ARUDO